MRDERTLQWGRNFFVTEICVDPPQERDLQCFNGAVTFSLRKLIKWSNNGLRKSWLQWGRNFFVTEIGDRVSFSSSVRCLLQWGRNFFVTEIRGCGIEMHSVPEKLQWGRNFFVTEIRMTVELKKEGWTLQWGRNFFVTEIGTTEEQQN